MDRLKIYEVDSNYVKYLSNYQKHIFYSDASKSSRKYIGIILEINGFKYFAPLASFKKKHGKMSEGVDFIKIKDWRGFAENFDPEKKYEQIYSVSLIGIRRTIKEDKQCRKRQKSLCRKLRK